MNLEELKIYIDHTIENLHHYESPKDIQVLITLSENSIGGRASSGVDYVGMGFDWEHGQFRIEPNKNLVKKGNTLTDIKPVTQREFDGRKYYVCPRCEEKVTKSDIFCRRCGQRLR